ncbi:MAG: hypothetical protein PHT07_20715 [Paludibacter sp.]|nr:hypothetical protein [Paludibacter sp.]
MADDYANKLALALQGIPPSQGGLNATNYPNQWGLRAYKNPDGSYGGEMMPKWTGWQGLMQNIAYPDSVSSELSVGDQKGDFPSMVPTTTPEQLSRLLSLKENQRMPQDIYETARQFAEQRRAKGLSPFKDVWDK